MGHFGGRLDIRQRGRHTSISGSARLGTALCTSVLANPAFALLSRIRLKAPAPSTTKVLSLEMKFELKTLVQSAVPRRSAPLTGILEERPQMCPMWTTSGCLARREPHLDFSNATRGTSLGVFFRGLRTPVYLYEPGSSIDVNGLLRFGTALCTSVLARGPFQS